MEGSAVHDFSCMLGMNKGHPWPVGVQARQQPAWLPALRSSSRLYILQPDCTKPCTVPSTSRCCFHFILPTFLFYRGGNQGDVIFWKVEYKEVSYIRDDRFASNSNPVTLCSYIEMSPCTPQMCTNAPSFEIQMERAVAYDQKYVIYMYENATLKLVFCKTNRC